MNSVDSIITNTSSCLGSWEAINMSTKRVKHIKQLDYERSREIFDKVEVGLNKSEAPVPPPVKLHSGWLATRDDVYVCRDRSLKTFYIY